MRKDEKHIKNLLAKYFAGCGNFQRFEYTAYGIDFRPDFVILTNSNFIYFEIKSEYDSFQRLQEQMEKSRHLFTEFYLVAPEKFREKFKKFKEKLSIFSDNWEFVSVEDLEKGKIPTIDISSSKIKTNIASSVLWKEEIKILIKEKTDTKEIFYTDDIGYKIKYNQMNKDELGYWLPILFGRNKGMEILNKILPKRIYEL